MADDLRHASKNAIQILASRRSFDGDSAWRCYNACSPECIPASDRREMAYKAFGVVFYESSALGVIDGKSKQAWEDFKRVNCPTCRVLLDAAIDGRNLLEDIHGSVKSATGAIAQLTKKE